MEEKPVERPEWYPAEFTEGQEREKTARAVFQALIYIGDQIGRLVDHLKEKET